MPLVVGQVGSGGQRARGGGALHRAVDLAGLEDLDLPEAAACRGQALAHEVVVDDRGAGRVGEPDARAEPERARPGVQAAPRGTGHQRARPVEAVGVAQESRLAERDVVQRPVVAAHAVDHRASRRLVHVPPAHRPGRGDPRREQQGRDGRGARRDRRSSGPKQHVVASHSNRWRLCEARTLARPPEPVKAESANLDRTSRDVWMNV